MGRAQLGKPSATTPWPFEGTGVRQLVGRAPSSRCGKSLGSPGRGKYIEILRLGPMSPRRGAPLCGAPRGAPPAGRTPWRGGAVSRRGPTSAVLGERHEQSSSITHAQARLVREIEHGALVFEDGARGPCHGGERTRCAAYAGTALAEQFSDWRARGAWRGLSRILLAYLRGAANRGGSLRRGNCPATR